MGEGSLMSFPTALKLKGAGNYTEWKTAILNMARGAGLRDYLDEDQELPPQINIKTETDKDKVAKWKEWD
jgi:hypothetical protein